MNLLSKLFNLIGLSAELSLSMLTNKRKIIVVPQRRIRMNFTTSWKII